MFPIPKDLFPNHSEDFCVGTFDNPMFNHIDIHIISSASQFYEYIFTDENTKKWISEEETYDLLLKSSDEFSIGIMCEISYILCSHRVKLINYLLDQEPFGGDNEFINQMVLKLQKANEMSFKYQKGDNLILRMNSMKI